MAFARAIQLHFPIVFEYQIRNARVFQQPRINRQGPMKRVHKDGSGMTRSRDVAIVGIYEYPLRDVEGKISPLQMKAECAASALADAGLNWSDVDAIYDAGEGGGTVSYTHLTLPTILRV